MGAARQGFHPLPPDMCAPQMAREREVELKAHYKLRSGFGAVEPGAEAESSLVSSLYSQCHVQKEMPTFRSLTAREMTSPHTIQG